MQKENWILKKKLPYFIRVTADCESTWKLRDCVPGCPVAYRATWSVFCGHFPGVQRSSTSKNKLRRTNSRRRQKEAKWRGKENKIGLKGDHSAPESKSTQSFDVSWSLTVLYEDANARHQLDCVEYIIPALEFRMHEFIIWPRSRDWVTSFPFLCSILIFLILQILSRNVH